MPSNRDVFQLRVIMGKDEMNAQLCIEDEEMVFKRADRTRLVMLACGILWLVTIAIFIGVVCWFVSNNNPSDDDTCTTRHCVMTAGRMLQNIDPEVDPCDNFYEFACGGFIKRTVLPEDKSSLSSFSTLEDDVEVILKELLERKHATDEQDAIKKSKDFYASCLDLDAMETRDKQPLIQVLQDLGGWPVLGDSEGGSWNERTYDFETSAARLQIEYYRSVYFGLGVTSDDKDSTRHVLYLDQSGLGMGNRDYYLQDQYKKNKDAYFNLMVKVATMLGANKTIATTDMQAVLDYETSIANLWVPPEDRRDSEALYNPTTVSQLAVDYPLIHWQVYLDRVMPKETKPITNTDVIINMSPEYLTNATKLTFNTPDRVIANHMMWLTIKSRVPSLSKRFRDAYQVYAQVFSGTSTIPPRWRDCVGNADGLFSFATGRMYIEEHFLPESKENVLKLIANLKTAFKNMLKYNDWMDEETKKAAKDKCDAIQEKIGYPDWIKSDSKLNEYYKGLSVTVDKYFENILAFNKWSALDSFRRLRIPVDKNEWFMGPATVNAYYSQSNNQIVFPAAILQPPFYHPDSPWYLNYGGIGTVIGHEITHGFDDQGRQYDKEGNLKQWWTNSSVSNFKKRAKCIVDQYSKYIMPEVNKTLNGIQVQGENIADNGGIKESLKAYRDNDNSKMKFPGFEDYSPEQLFYLSFAQVWCTVARPESIDSSILSDPHSPGRYRVIGTAHNSKDFSKAYNCPAKSYMNPKDKCDVW